MTAANTRYWINTVSRGHTRVGVEGGFTQADHGKKQRLERLNEGDWIVFYSPRTEFRGGDPVRAFTALGRVAGGDCYQVVMTPEFQPWRRDVDFLPCKEAPIRPLVGKLDFIENKDRWGYPFRRGLFEVGEKDFQQIAEAMGARFNAFAEGARLPTVPSSRAS